MCKAVEAAGADAISLTNTFQACAIDLEKRRPVFNNIFAGLSGPAVRPSPCAWSGRPWAP